MKNIILILTLIASVFISSCNDITDEYEVSIEKDTKKVVDTVYTDSTSFHYDIEYVDGYKVTVAKLFYSDGNYDGGYYSRVEFVEDEDEISDVVIGMKDSIIKLREKDIEIFKKESELRKVLNR